jgi:hypothetical protein
MNETVKTISFDVDGVLADARRKSGLDDFGSSDYLPGLKVLLDTYDQRYADEKLRKQKRRRVVDLLIARAKIEAAWNAHPEIKNIAIKRPMYLTGLPRTGTSALLNLLAVDPDARPLKLWEGLNPDPLPGNPPESEDPRFIGMKQFYDEMNRNADFRKIHSTSAETPEECIHLLNHTFSDVQFGYEPLMEPYGSWFRKQDLRASYHYYADILRLLQWQRPGNRWLLKSPCHLWALDVITEMFPDSSVIITHRNPLESVASYCSMMEAMMAGRADLDKRELGVATLNYLADKLQRSYAQRAKIDPKRILDLQFNDFIGDPIAVVRKIYAHFELPLKASTLSAMQQYQDAHPMGKHGKHEYDLASYGLTESQVMQRFAFYRDWL